MTDLTLTIDATVPTNTSVEAIVYEDTDSDGTAENAVNQSISDGTNEYTLSGFDGSSGNDVWVEIVLDNSDITKTASVNSIELSN